MRLFLFILILSLPVNLFSFDLYYAIDSLVPKNKIPRILNSEDFRSLDVPAPQALIAPEGDFNKDGTIDRAVSGIYQLPSGSKKYFLLIASQQRNPIRFQSLYFKEFDNPVLLFEPGTTGQGDPGDQDFSVSFCVNCDQGYDFYWNSKKKTFDQKKWIAKFRHTQKVVEVPAEEIPQEDIDLALRIVGGLKEVKAYVGQLNKEGKRLGTRVEKDSRRKKSKRRYWVSIFEKTEAGKNPFRTILVDCDKKKVLKKKKPKKPKR